MDIKKAGFTVEASLLIPAVVFILVLLIVSTTFLLDKNILISLSVCEAVCGRKQDDSSLTGLCHHEILCEKSDKQRSASYSVKSGFFGRLFYEEESVSYKEYDPAKLLKGEAALGGFFNGG